MYHDRWAYQKEKDMFALKEIVCRQGFDWLLEEMVDICDDLSVEQNYIEHYWREMNRKFLQFKRSIGRTFDTDHDERDRLPIGSKGRY
jgi:hypothetical protein